MAHTITYTVTQQPERDPETGGISARINVVFAKVFYADLVGGDTLIGQADSEKRVQDFVIRWVNGHIGLYGYRDGRGPARVPLGDYPGSYGDDDVYTVATRLLTQAHTNGNFDHI